MFQLDLLDTTHLDLSLETPLRCQFGEQDVLADAKCLLECAHEAHAYEQVCSEPATWEELMECHKGRTFLCDNHANLVRNRIDFGVREAAKDGDDLECFHCDGLFDAKFNRL